MKDIEIHAFFDEESGMWVAEYDEIGLATEAGSIDILTYKLQEMIPELVDLNNIDVPGPDCRKDFDKQISKLRIYN